MPWIFHLPCRTPWSEVRVNQTLSTVNVEASHPALEYFLPTHQLWVRSNRKSSLRPVTLRLHFYGEEIARAALQLLYAETTMLRGFFLMEKPP
jgi:hypothetical protein